MNKNKLETNKEIIKRLYDAFNQNDLVTFEEVASPDCVTMTSAQPYSRDVWKEQFVSVREGSSDVHSEIKHLVAEGDMVVVHAYTTGTHTGNFMGFPATDKPYEFHSIAMFKIEDGKAVARWDVADSLTMMTQLGLASMAQPS